MDSAWKDDYPVSVFSDGTVIWIFSGYFSSSCDLNMFKFPFDTQVCFLVISNFGNVDNTTNITGDYIAFRFFSENQEFRYTYLNNELVLRSDSVQCGVNERRVLMP